MRMNGTPLLLPEALLPINYDAPTDFMPRIICCSSHLLVIRSDQLIITNKLLR